jgi:hypothetical protein
MPNTAENRDIAFQPASKGYSYSNPQMLEQRSNEKKRGMFFSLGFEILGLLVLFILFLAVLNYFSGISLNSINPTLFGFLPTNKSNTQVPANAPSLSSKISSNSLKNQATDEQITKYAADIQAGKAPVIATNDQIYGYFSGFDQTHFQIISVKGIRIFLYDDKTIFGKIYNTSINPSSSSATLITTPLSSKDALNTSNFGKVLNITFSPSNTAFKADLVLFQ